MNYATSYLAAMEQSFWEADGLWTGPDIPQPYGNRKPITCCWILSWSSWIQNGVKNSRSVL